MSSSGARYRKSDFCPGCSKVGEELNEADLRTILCGIAREDAGGLLGLEYAYSEDDFESAMAEMVKLGWMAHYRTADGRRAMARFITEDGWRVVEEGW